MSSRLRPGDAPADSARFYLCAGCRRQVRICRPCDRGNQYCDTGCAQKARDQARKEAGARYQKTCEGKKRHALRQSRWRDGQKKKVTHQGPPVGVCEGQGGDISVRIVPTADTPKETPDETPAKQQTPAALPPQEQAGGPGGAPGPEPAPPGIVRCDFCQRVCSPYVRRERLATWRKRQGTGNHSRVVP
jgi:hypothetical protein